MKTEKEIRDKIKELEELASEAFQEHDSSTEHVCRFVGRTSG